MKLDGRTLSHEMSEKIRRMAVQRVREGEKPSVVIKSFGFSRTCIYPWIRAARTQGVRALAARTPPGRRPAPTPPHTGRVRRGLGGKDARPAGFYF